MKTHKSKIRLACFVMAFGFINLNAGKENALLDSVINKYRSGAPISINQTVAARAILAADARGESIPLEDVIASLQVIAKVPMPSDERLLAEVKARHLPLTFKSQFGDEAAFVKAKDYHQLLIDIIDNLSKALFIQK